MGRQEQAPTESASNMSKDGVRYSHPAYGMIAASHVQGGAVLFGTDFVHQHFVVVRISPAELQRDLAHDWHHAKSMPYVEVAMSEAQWATFVSRPNMGQGTPCTVQYADGREMPSIPLRRSTDAHEEDFRDKVKGLAEMVASTSNAITNELAGLSNKKREAALVHLRRLEMELASNLPWYVKVLEEQMHKTVESAKVEVSAYINHAITRAGLDAIASGTASPLLLTAPTDAGESK